MASTLASAEWTASVRKKVFTKWINMYCKCHSLVDKVTDNFSELQDGITLCLILEAKHKDKKLLKHDSKDGLLERKQKIENVEQVIQEVNSIGGCWFTVQPDAIVDGDQEATLELVWCVICMVQLFEKHCLNVEATRDEMLQWVNRKVKGCSLKVTDFSTNWSDGKAFCAVIYDYHVSSFTYAEVEKKDRAARLKYAFEFAYKMVSVEKLLDAEDVAVPIPDERCILLYLSVLRQKLVFLPSELNRLKAIRSVWIDVSRMDKEDLPILQRKLHDWGPPVEDMGKLEEQLKELKDLKVEYDEFGMELSKIENKRDLEYQPNLQNDFDKLKTKFNGDKDVLNKVMTAAEHCHASVKEFDSILRAVGCWLKEAKADVQCLLVMANDEARHEEARQSLLSIQQAAVERWNSVDRLRCCASDFAKEREKVVVILTGQKTVPTSDVEKGSSLMKQAQEVLKDWEWILNQCINVLHKWFTIVLTWKLDEDFSSNKEKRESFLHICNSVFEVLYRISETCTNASGLNLPALRTTKDDANHHWLSMCSQSETLKELHQLNDWVIGFLDELSSQRPLADTLEGVQLQKLWYQDFLQRVAQREPEVLRYETLHLTVHNQPVELHEASEIMKEHQLLRDHWIKLQQLKQTWEELLDSCEAAWESCLATERKLRLLEDVHAKWEPPAENQDILLQLREIETFQASRVVPFKSEVYAMADLEAHLKSLGGHPPVEELCCCVTTRYNQLLTSLTTMCAATEPCYQVVTKFERVRETFVSWLVSAMDRVTALFPVPHGKVSRDNARTSLCGVQKDAQERKNDIEELRQLAHTFRESREALIMTMPRSMVQAVPASKRPSLATQADHLYEQWHNILKHSIGYPEVITFKSTVTTPTVGHDFSLLVYTKDAGEGELTAAVQGEKSGCINCTVRRTDSDSDIWLVTFFVSKLEKYTIRLFWSGIELSQSPFDALPPDEAAMVKVDGPHPCSEGTGLVHTFIDTSEAGEGDLQVECETNGEDGGPIKVNVAVKKEQQPAHFDAVFEASKTGTYTVHVSFSGKPVPNSPFIVPVKVFDINKVVVTGFEEGVQVVGETIYLTVDCSQAGSTEQPMVTSETPSKGKGKKRQGKKEVIHLSERDSDSGVFDGEFTPMSAGRHKIHVQISGKGIPNTPFIVRAAAQQERPSIYNSSVYLFGCSNTIVNLDLALPWTVSSISGYAKRHSTDDELQLNLKKTTNPGQFRCSFWPSGPGVYTLHVHDSKTKNHIEGSPFEVIVLEPTAPKHGNALFQTHRAALRFIMHTDDILTASCTGKEAGPVTADVVRKTDNTSCVQIGLEEPDLYTVEVKTGSRQFPGSPFSFSVLPPLTYDDPSKVVPKISNDPIKLGEHYSLTVLTHGAGDGKLTAKVEGSKSGAVPFKINQVEKEKWVISFLVESPEVYMVYLYWNGTIVPNIPLKLFPPDASKCRVHHLPSDREMLLTHKDIVYYVDTTDAGFGELFIKSEGPSIATQPSTIKAAPPSGKQTSYEVAYTPTAAGIHKHSIYWSGEAIPQSPLTFKVVDEEALQLYSEAKAKLDEFFASTEPQLHGIDVSIHAQPAGEDQGSPERRQWKLQLDVLPVTLLQRLEVISKEKAATHTYYETFMREGQTLCNLSSAEDEKSKVKEEMEQYQARWLQVVTLHGSLDRDCQALKLQFQTFLDSMLALVVWLYSTWSSLMPDEERPLQVTSTGNGDGPGDQWSAVKAAEDSLPLQKCKITSLHKDGFIWACLPLLHESYSERFVKAFVEDVSVTQHTSLLLFQDGISILQQKFADLEQLIAIFKLIRDASYTLDTILRWITSQETHYGTSLSVVPTQDTHTGRHHLEELKHLAKELSDKANEKETAIAKAQQVLQKTGPTRAKEFGKKVDAVVSVWTRVHDGCTEVKTVLHKYLPEMESLWNNIKQCEKRLDDMDRQQHQVDSATHGNILKSVQSIRTQWKQLTESYPSLKDVIPSFNDPTGTPAFDAESRIEALEKRVSKYNKLQKLKDDLQELLKWFQWARDATIPEARADFSLTSLMEQLQKLEEFKEILRKKQGEIPPLQTRAEGLSQSDMVLTLLRLSTEVETKCTNRKQFLETLISRWKAFLANADTLLKWTKKTRDRLCEVVADKDSHGVEDHLATCKELKESVTKKAAEFDQFKVVAATLEGEVKREGWDTEEVTAKNAEVQQSRDSLLDFIDKTQADLQAVAKRLKALLLIVTEKQAWLKDFTKRIVLWRPCFGDVSIVKSELNAAKGLLAETHTHADGIKQLVDNADFVMEHSRQGERKQVKADIMDLCQCHADHKRQLQDKVSQCQTALPLWQRFTATTTELTMLIEEKEKLLSSLAMLPSYDSDEDEGMAERIKSVQHDLVDGKDKLQLLKSLEADLTDTCDMEEDRTYIAKKCAEVRGQFDHVMKMARDALALCYICEGIRQLQCLLQQHRSLPSPSTLPGPELAKRHKGLLDDSKSIEQQTQSALKDVRKAVQAAKKGGSTITPKIQQAVDTVTADAEQLPAAAKSWREDLTNRYSAWTQFREGLEQYIQSATEVHTRVETEIVAQPIGIHLKELDAFKNELQTMLSQTKAAQKGLPPLKMSAEKFLFGEGQPVVELRDAFTLAIKQQKGTATHLEDYLNRLTSWEKYFDLFKDALAWFNPFKQVAERDIQKFEKEGSQRNSSHTKLKGHLSVMESKRVMVDQVRDFPLPIDDVQSERESVQDIVDQRDVFVKDYVQLKKRLESLIVWQSPINGYSFTYTQCLLLLLLLLFLIILCPVLVLSWLQYTCSYCSGFMYYITPSHEVPI